MVCHDLSILPNLPRTIASCSLLPDSGSDEKAFDATINFSREAIVMGLGQPAGGLSALASHLKPQGRWAGGGGHEMQIRGVQGLPF